MEASEEALHGARSKTLTLVLKIFHDILGHGGDHRNQLVLLECSGGGGVVSRNAVGRHCILPTL